MRDFLHSPGGEPACAEAGAKTHGAAAAAVPSLQRQFWEAKSTRQLLPSAQSRLLKKNTLVPFTLTAAGQTPPGTLLTRDFSACLARQSYGSTLPSLLAQHSHPPNPCPFAPRRARGAPPPGAEGCHGPGMGFHRPPGKEVMNGSWVHGNIIFSS